MLQNYKEGGGEREREREREMRSMWVVVVGGQSSAVLA
jgi:hypothetical protein